MVAVELSPDLLMKQNLYTVLTCTCSFSEIVFHCEDLVCVGTLMNAFIEVNGAVKRRLM